MASVCFCSRFNPLKVDSSLIPCRNFVAARSILAFSNPKGRQRFGAIGVTKGRRSAVAANMFKIEREPLETGQESVWDYPRPPRLEPVEETISVKFNSAWIAHTQKAYRVLETSHPPGSHIPLSGLLSCCNPSITEILVFCSVLHSQRGHQYGVRQ